MANMKLLRGLAVLMTAGCALGLTACATCEDGACSGDEEMYVVYDDTAETYAATPNCAGAAGECLVGQDDGSFLTENFVETYAVNVPTASNDATGKKAAADTLVIQDDAALALSRPATTRGVSVKNKRVVTTAPETVTVKTVKTETVPATVIIPAAPVEKPPVQAEEPVVQETIAEADVVSEPAVVSVEETVVPTEPQEKKVTTTITETTTTKKVQPEIISEDGVETDTLKGRIAYGQQIHDWEARPGDTLRTLLMAWGEKSGWTVVWKLDRDYHLEAGVVFRGNFTDAAGAIVRSFARATPAPIGTFYQGNRVLVISTQEDENER